MSLSRFFLQTMSCLIESCFLSPPRFFWKSFSLLLIIFWIITKLIGREAGTVVALGRESPWCSLQFGSSLSPTALRSLFSWTSFQGWFPPPSGDARRNSPDHRDSLRVLLQELYYLWPLCMQTSHKTVGVHIRDSWHITAARFGAGCANHIPRGRQGR